MPHMDRTRELKLDEVNYGYARISPPITSFRMSNPSQATVTRGIDASSDRTGMAVRVGHLVGETLPRDSMLVEVECQSLSRSGFAYWVISRPHNTGVLVVFGEGPNEVRIRSRVIDCKVA